MSHILAAKEFTLPRSRRLRDAKAFSAVFQFRHQIRGEYIQIYAKPNGLPFSRLGLIVSKKVENGAVERNRMKRLLRETFRMTQDNSNTVQMDWVMRTIRPINADISRQFVSEIRLLMFQLRKCLDSSSV